MEVGNLRFRILTGAPRSGSVIIKVVPMKKERGAEQAERSVGEVIVIDSGSPRNRPGTRTVTVSVGAMHDCTPEIVRRAGGSAAKWLNSHGVTRAALESASLEQLGVDGSVECFCEGFALGAFRFDRHKSGDQPNGVSTLDIIAKRARSGLAKRIQRITPVTDAVNLARDWGHEPPNVINPVTLAARVVRLARASNLKCKVLDDKQLAKMKAAALLSVGVASKTHARFIILVHRGSARG